MAQQVVFLTQLRPGVTPAAYEQWVREVDYPTARGLTSIRSYRVIRIEGPIVGTPELPAAYAELIEVTDVNNYQKEVANLPGRDQFIQEVSSLLGSAIAGYGAIIE